MIDVFLYIASNKPDEAAQLCYAFGFSPETYEDGAACLREIFVNGGLDEQMQIMDLHPEKDLLLEMFLPNETAGSPLNKMLIKTNQADGDSSTMAPGTLPSRDYLSALKDNPTITILALASIFTLGAIIINNKK